MFENPTMVPRTSVHLRAVGETTGFKVRLPQTWKELLDVSSKLVLGGNVTRRVYDKLGDQLVAIDVINPDDVVYVTSTDAWRRPPKTEDDATSVKKGVRWERRQAGKAAAVAAASAVDNPFMAVASLHGQSSLLATALLGPAIRATPVVRGHETPTRLCSGRPPYGLLGDPSQLGSDANFSKLRGVARQQAHIGLCVATAKRMQARNSESVGPVAPIFPPGATCAVVGSSGALTRGGHGRAIDAHRVVMRFNLAPAGGEWSADVGSRTTVRILTDKVVAPYMKSAGKAKVPTSRFGRAAEPASTLLLYCMAQGWVGKCMHENRVSHVNPVFLKHLRAELDAFHGRGRLPSAGLAGMAMALAHCSTVTLYGFGNASDARANGTEAAQCGHYWECKRQQGQYFAGKQGYHDWSAQWRVMNSWFERADANETVRGRLVFVDAVAKKANA